MFHVTPPIVVFRDDTKKISQFEFKTKPLDKDYKPLGIYTQKYSNATVASLNHILQNNEYKLN